MLARTTKGAAATVARVVYTPALNRFFPCPSEEVAGATVREALDQAFDRNPRVRPYILDEHGAVRHHVAIFVDGALLRDRVRLSDPAPERGEIYVMQSLSGG
jgi:hypothetical protein